MIQVVNPLGDNRGSHPKVAVLVDDDHTPIPIPDKEGAYSVLEEDGPPEPHGPPHPGNALKEVWQNSWLLVVMGGFLAIICVSSSRTKIHQPGTDWCEGVVCGGFLPGKDTESALWASLPVSPRIEMGPPSP